MEIKNKRILECVPNFSEGRDPQKMNQILNSIQSVPGVKVLHTDVGYDANRTVVTFAGKPELVIEAAYRAVAKASEIIDMSTHQGVHPRIGATDILPLVPVSGITMEETVELSYQLAKRIGENLQIPIYCYEYSAKQPYRKKLESIRKGEYEGLKYKLTDPLWTPDFGPIHFNIRSGATTLGARKFLVAFNVNLDTQSLEIAKKIAGMVRESGFTQILDGIKTHQPGLLKTVKAIGWRMEQYKKVQVSMNITDIDQTPLHEAFHAVQTIAQKLNTRVTGSELIGLIPLKAMLDAGAFFLNQNTTDPKTLINEAIKKMGLDELSPFDYTERILEYKLL